jgi:hypothetical protein
MSDLVAPSTRFSDGATVAPTPRPEPTPDPKTVLRLANIRSELAEHRRGAEALRAEVANLPDVLDDHRTGHGQSLHVARLNLRRAWAEAEAKYEGLAFSERRETAEAAQ